MILNLRSVTSILAIGLVAFASCKKKSDDSPKSKLVGKWKFTKSAKDMNNNGTIDAGEMFTFSDSISGYIQFNSDGTGLDASTNSGTTQTDNFNWALIDNNADIKITQTSGTGSGMIDTLHIVSLTSSDLEISQTYATGTTMSTNWAFMHKQ